MKLSIDLDMNRIDYDAINEQILQQLSEIDLGTVYEINSKVRQAISDYVKERVDSIIGSEYSWSNKSKEEVQSVVREEIRKLTAPYIENVVEFTNEPEFKELALQLFKECFINIMIGYVCESIDNYKYCSQTELSAQMYSMMDNYMRR